VSNGKIFFKHPYCFIFGSEFVTSLNVSDISNDLTYLSNSDNVYSISPFGSSLSTYTFKLGLALISISQTLNSSSIKISRPKI
jgi:hypothetical protein